jgi:putative membrane protein
MSYPLHTGDFRGFSAELDGASGLPCRRMKTKSPALCCALLVSAVTFCSALSAQSSSSATGSSTGSTTSTTSAERRSATDVKLSHGDRSFFEKAAKSGMKEVAVSQAALPNLTNPQVKNFAQMMVADHSGANTELMSLASTKGVLLPDTDKKDMKLTDKWSKKVKDADEEYMEEMVSDHKDAVDLFEKASKSDDAAIAAFAQKTLPTLQHHLTMAQDLKKQVK